MTGSRRSELYLDASRWDPGTPHCRPGELTLPNEQVNILWLVSKTDFLVGLSKIDNMIINVAVHWFLKF